MVSFCSFSAHKLERNMNYWIAVNNDTEDKSILQRGELKTFWCMPLEAKQGDLVLFYCPRASSVKKQGIYAQGVIEYGPEKTHKNNYLCSAYGTNSVKGRLYYAAICVQTVFVENLKFSTLRHLPSMVDSGFVRKNSQGTTFRVTEAQYYEMLRELMCKQSTR